MTDETKTTLTLTVPPKVATWLRQQEELGNLSALLGDLCRVSTEAERDLQALAEAAITDSNAAIAYLERLSQKRQDIQQIPEIAEASSDTPKGLCTPCAEAKGGTWPDGHVATLWQGQCTVCGQIKSVCAESDWVFPGQRRTLLDFD